jgi:hypothetical protein
MPIDGASRNRKYAADLIERPAIRLLVKFVDIKFNLTFVDLIWPRNVVVAFDEAFD